MRLIIDGNSYLNQALLRGTDHDGGRVVTDESGKQVQVNSALYGVEGFFDKLTADLEHFDAAPRQCVLVWDGANAKLMRRTFLPTYKEGRDKHEAVSEELNKAREDVTRMALDLGMTVVHQDKLEADDVIGYLCKNMRTQRNVVVTADGDLSVLVDDNTDVWRLGELNKNPVAVGLPHKYITLYKALVGDTSDKIPGAKGFGDAAFTDLVRIFGLEGLDQLQVDIENGTLHTLAENVPDFKPLQKVIDSKDMVTTSWRVASLMIDRVNTMKSPLTIQAGMVKQWSELAEDARVFSLRKFYGTKTLVTAENYAVVFDRLNRTRFEGSPFVALDIETSASPESEEWLQRLKELTETDRARIDVLGHELTGMSLTFGTNTQHTIYMSVDHEGTDNITVDQCREMVELIPQKLHTIIQNRQFEFSVLYRTWGDKWKDNGWHGFVPNALDSKIGAAYTDENLRKGLKERSKHHLGYEQKTYAETTQFSGVKGTLVGGELVKEYKVVVEPATYFQIPHEVTDEETGEITIHFTDGKDMSPAVTQDWEVREYRMNQLTAEHVFDYGCDDTICTAALHTHYQFVMELEHTWDVYLKVEQLPEYLTSLAFVQGIEVSLPKLLAMERKDDERYTKAWETLRVYLLKHGWAGTICPEFENSIDTSDAKLAIELLVSEEFTTKKRKLNAIALELREQFPDNAIAILLSRIIDAQDVDQLNALMRKHFTGEPKINFGSPKQMQNLFYRVIGIRPRIFNKMTEKQRSENEAMAEGFKKLRRAKDAKVDLFTLKEEVEVSFEYNGKTKKAKLTPLTTEERDALISKASTDDTAVDTALAMDGATGEVKEVLEAYKSVKEVQTRRSLFYKSYKALPHWRDGRIHPSLNQSEAVTLRYSASAPNIQQVSANGDGAELREFYLAHSPEAIVVSLDFSGQELRIGAELSGDEAMTSCYVGDNLRDMHSLTAVSAAILIWGEEVTYDEFQKMRKSSDAEVKVRATALRNQAKTTNFAAAYGSGAMTVGQGLMVEEEIAQQFLDARAAAFPGYVAWDLRVQEEGAKIGYSRTMLGARRHLRTQLMSDNSWDVSKAKRQIGNFWIQASAAEMTKLAMGRVWSSGIVTGRFDAKFLFPVHDELVFSVHRSQAVAFIKEAHACMVANYAGMKIPLESSIAMGRTFGCEVEIGNHPTEEAILKGLEEVFAA